MKITLAMKITGTIRTAVLVLLACSGISASAAPPVVRTEKTPKTQLYVRTFPSGAEIRLDGDLLGTSDDVFAVEPGRRQLAVTLYGHVAQRQTISISKGRIHRVTFRLRRASESPEFDFLRSRPSESTLRQPRRKQLNEAQRLPPGTWYDVLKWVDTARDRVRGAWSRSGHEIAVVPTKSEPDFLRLMLPVVVQGSYDLEVEFTRTSGNETLGVYLPVGSGACVLHLSAFAGRFAGLDMVDGQGIGTPGKPDNSQPSVLTNGHRYRLLVHVRLTGDKAAVDASLDEQPFLKWSGSQSSLQVWGGWRLPEKNQPGLVNQTAATFHSVKLRPLSADAYRPVHVVRRRETMPEGQWVDLLKLVDLEQDKVRGKWVRDGHAITVSPAEGCEALMLPAQLHGSYDFEVEFTRVTGDGSVNVNLPVGPRACTLQLGAWSGHAGGLEMIHGMSVGTPGNPAAVRPNPVANGRRHKVLCKIRTTDTKASVEVSLNDEPFVSWEGEQSALSTWGGWTMPTPSRPMLGANEGNIVRFHSAKARCISGKATIFTSSELARQ